MADAAYEEQLRAYVADDSATDALVFPPTLDGQQRAEIHSIAQGLGLRAWSQGSKEDGDRFISVKRYTEEELSKKQASDEARKAREVKREEAAKKREEEAARWAKWEQWEEAEEQEEEEWEDLREAETSLYDTLKVTKSADGDSITGGSSRVRAAYHKQIVKCNRVLSTALKLGVEALLCESCNTPLSYGRWYHCSAAFRDACKWCASQEGRILEHNPTSKVQSEEEEEDPPEDGEVRELLWQKVCDKSDVDSERYRSVIQALADEAARKKRFRQVTLAYLILKDEEKRRIYNTHGWTGIVQSERYQEYDAFDTDPYVVYENFFAGVDPEDKEYLMLNGTEPVSDDEEEGEDDQKQEEEAAEAEADEEEEEEEEEQEEDNEEVLLAAALKAGEAAREKDSVMTDLDLNEPPPRPPTQVLGVPSLNAAMRELGPPIDDPWKRLLERDAIKKAAGGEVGAANGTEGPDSSSVRKRSGLPIENGKKKITKA